MASGDRNKEMKYLEQLIQERFSTVLQILESLETRVEHINSGVQSLAQDSTEMFGFLEDLVDSVGAIKTSSRKTQSFVRRISQNLNGPNDISRVSRLKKNSLYGSMESVRTHSASRESETDDSSHDPPQHGKVNHQRPKTRRQTRLSTIRPSALPGTLKPRPHSSVLPKEREGSEQDNARDSGNLNNYVKGKKTKEDEEPGPTGLQEPSPTPLQEQGPTGPQVSSSTGPREPSPKVPREPSPTVFDPPPDVNKQVCSPPPSSSVPIVEPLPQATPVEYQSPESFLHSVNVQIQDPNLISALSNMFHDSPAHPQFPNGLYTILLIDVSSSINKDMFKEVENFIDQMVDEVETSAADHNLEEMMAVLTFGGQCEVVQHFTNDYMPIKDALQEKVKLGGKSPMLFGLAMAVAYCHKFGKWMKVNGHVVNQRILMFTDGFATDSNDKHACQGTDYETNSIKVQSDMFKFLPVLERSSITVSCIGIGECNQVILKDIAERGHGHFYSLSNTQNALRLGRYYFYQNSVTRAKTAISQDNGQSDPKDIALQYTTATHLTDVDREEILQLLKIGNGGRKPSLAPPPTKIEPKKPSIRLEPEPPPNLQPTQPPPQDVEKQKPEELTPYIPPLSVNVSPPPNIPPKKIEPPDDSLGTSGESVVPSSPDLSDGEVFESYGQPHNRCFPWGTRVIRGENWQWSDDQNMPGTVVAHKSEGVVVVKWDCGSHGEYPQENLFRINDPRALKPGEVIEVGCLVKRGPNWNRGDEDGGPEATGSVIRKHRNNKVSVIWPIGIVDRYSYDENNKELEVVGSGSSAAPTSFVGAFGGMEPIEPEIREPADGEEVVWQWIDCDTNEFHSFSKEEKDKLEDIYRKKTGTVLVSYKGQQLRCQPAQWKYRDYTVKSRAGKLHRRVCTHDEANTFYLIESI